MPLSKYSNYMTSSFWEAAPAPDDEEEESPAELQAGQAAVTSPPQGQLGAEVRAGPALEEAIFDMGIEFEQFRAAYRNFRTGHYRGARGEAPQPLEELPHDSSLDDLLEVEDTNEPVYVALQEFRLTYRRHRLGEARGAKGEITDLGKRLTIQKVKLLPVAQLASLRKHLQVWADTREESAAISAASLLTGDLHLHVGAGRLGLGLVLPAIVESGRPFGIVQRPSESWSRVGKASEVEVRLNGDALTKLHVVRTPMDAVEAKKQGKKSLLVLSEEVEVLGPMVASTSTYSCSIGGKDLEGALEPLFKAVRAAKPGSETSKPPIYCCENDHDAVAKLESAIGQHLELVPVLVDRVCTSREIGEDAVVAVSSEPYPGDLVIPPPSGRPRGALPFGGPTVRLPSTEEGAALLHRKKILTVNGTHTTLAFLTLVAAEPQTVGPPQGSHELLAFDLDAAAAGGPGQVGTAGRSCWVWAVARQLMLLDEFEDDVLRYTLGGEEALDDQALCDALLKGARDAVRRLSSGGDQTSRVLGGGVVNRWQGRLANVAEWLDAQRNLTPLARLLLRTGNITTVELRQCITRLVVDSKRFTEPPPKRDASRSRTPSRHSLERRRRDAAASVLFDFDGTLGDTERPAMEVAFWMIAPYLPGLEGKSDEELLAECPVYVRENAGKAFEHMIEACDKQREAAGLPGVEATRTARQEPPKLLEAVDRRREALGLRKLADLRREGCEPETLLQQQKEDTVTRLGVAARPCPGVPEMLESLQAMGVEFVIATTSGKPRVPVCVDTAGLRHFFRSDDLHIHSGESDFDPPRFKPAPDVYLRAASSVKRSPANCVAVEDSASGVGSASNAGMGLIVGYVGAGHIAPEQRESHAKMLMKGTRAENGRGADVVIEDMRDLPAVVRHFSVLVRAGRAGDGRSRLRLRAADLPVLTGRAHFYADMCASVLFDFDGTLGDTESPAMEVAFWMIAPYLPGLEGKSDEELLAECPVFVRENAGKAFEHMIEACDNQRKAAGLPGTEATRAARQEPAALLAAVDRRRVALGLQPIAELRQQGREPATLLQQQKDDTVTRLAVAAQPCPGVVEALEALQAEGVSFVIATTSGKPRVPVCVDTAGLRRFFPSDNLHIHSGESDFAPPRFKPAPDVYLRAANFCQRSPASCVAVEDSASGVGSASNAGIGLIVGYVGAGHIATEQRESHAQMLMKGARADNGRGADIVIEDMRDLPSLVGHFGRLLARGGAGDGRGRLRLRAADVPGLAGRAHFHEE